MEQYLKNGVKEVISAFPQVGEILERYGIGCVPCAVGTCRLEEVVQVHALPAAQQARMMAEIEQAIFPDREVAVPQAASPATAAPRGEIAYSPPVRRLVEEHTWIKRLLAIVPAVVDQTRRSGAIDRQVVGGMLDFIRGFADRFHHMKEEDILFDYTDRQAEIIQVMLQDHDRARSLVRATAEAVEQDDCSALCSHLLAYRELLTEHITKEDDILYPYLDRGLTTSQVGEVFRRFDEVESGLKPGIPERYQRFIVNLEDKSRPKEEDRCHTISTDVRDRA